MTAAKSEAKKRNHVFIFEGEKYEVPPTSEWDLDVLEAVEEDKAVSIVKALLGAEQYAKFKNQKPRKVADLIKLFEALSRAVGLQGN